MFVIVLKLNLLITNCYGIMNFLTSILVFLIWLCKSQIYYIFFADRKQCILVCHDWGSIIGSMFVAKHEQMVQKYILMGAPPSKIFRKLLLSSLDQFKRSWYMIFFQMPILPELAMTCDDLVAFDKMFSIRRNEEMTDEHLQAYKYVFSKPGLCIHSIWKYIFI